MRRVGILFTLACIAICGCRTPARPPLATAPYARVAHADSNVIRLETALREFVPRGKGGPAIWLASVIHVGEPDYYRALQAHFATQRIVLYEGVGADGQATAPPPPSPVEYANHENEPLQVRVARSLGLVFQLEAIDYSGANMVNSDLSVGQLQRLIAATGSATNDANAVSRSFDNLLALMEGGSVLGSMLDLALGFVGNEPRAQALCRLTMIETLGSMEGDVSQLQGLPPEYQQLIRVLVQRRNEKVLVDLRPALKAARRSDSVTLFYGTAHMRDLEEHLRRDLGYVAASERWLPALSVNLGESGITPTAAKAMHEFVCQQVLEMFKRPAP